MTKEAYYFSHDANARFDPKSLKIRAKFGFEGYGIFWALIEILREATDYKYKLSDIDVIAYQLNLDFDKLNDFLEFCFSKEIGIFQKDDIYFWSDRLLRSMEEYNSYKEKQRENGVKGGRPKKKDELEKPKQNPTHNPNETQTKPTQNPNESMKEKEIKEIKEINILNEDDNHHQFFLKLQGNEVLKTYLEKNMITGLEIAEFFVSLKKDYSKDHILKALESYINKKIKKFKISENADFFIEFREWIKKEKTSTETEQSQESSPNCVSVEATKEYLQGQQSLKAGSPLDYSREQAVIYCMNLPPQVREKSVFYNQLVKKWDISTEELKRA